MVILKSETEFIRDINESAKYVDACVAWLTGRGLKAKAMPLVVRPDVSVKNDFLDNGDIEITKRIEVKHRSINFTSADDYPYDTVIVDELYKVDRSDSGDLDKYMIVNNKCTHICIVDSCTKNSWTTETHYDAAQKRTCTFYVCPLNKCAFYSL